MFCLSESLEAERWDLHLAKLMDNVRTVMTANISSGRPHSAVFFVRKHHSLGVTPAVAAGLEEKPWSLEQVVDMTESYWLRKSLADPGA
jgi:hypothetical protein